MAQDAADDELHRMMMQLLRPISVGFGALLLYFGLTELDDYTGLQRILIAGTDMVTGAFLLGLGIWMTVRNPPTHYGHPLGAIIALTITFTDSMTRAVEGVAADFPLVTMVVVGAGMSFLSTRWLAGVYAIIWAAYLGVVFGFTDGPPAWNVMLVATVLGAAIFYGRKRTVEHLVHAKHQEAKAREALEKKNQELDLFASTVAHDLQNPVAAVRLKAETLKLKVEEPLAPIVDDLRRIADNMGHMIEDVLQYARAGSRATMSEVDLNQLMVTIQVVFKEQLEETGAKLELNHLPTIRGDETQLEQLLLNLIGNSIHYHSDELLRIQVHGATTPDGTILTITDNGLGFAPEQAMKLFDRFTRGDSGRRGHGIGLATCRRIVENHGGTIRAASIQGSGAVFTVWLPTDMAKGADAPAPA